MDSVAETKACTKCEVQKSLKDFHKDSNNKCGLTSQCKACRKIQRMCWGKKHPEKVRKHKRDEYHRNREKHLEYTRSSERRDRWFRWKLKRQFGISFDDFMSLMDSQLGLCAICHGEMDRGQTSNKRLNIDHDHKTGKVRGLLCFRCNTGIGSLNDDPKVLASAIRYLMKERE